MLEKYHYEDGKNSVEVSDQKIMKLKSYEESNNFIGYEFSHLKILHWNFFKK